MKFESIQSVKALKISEMSKIKGGWNSYSVSGPHQGKRDQVNANGTVLWEGGTVGKSRVV